DRAAECRRRHGAERCRHAAGVGRLAHACAGRGRAGADRRRRGGECAARRAATAADARHVACLATEVRGPRCETSDGCEIFSQRRLNFPRGTPAIRSRRRERTVREAGVIGRVAACELRKAASMETDTSAPSQRPSVPVLGTVLCAVDSSAAAAGVLYTAAGLAVQRGSRLIILRAMNAPRGSDEMLAEQISLDALVRGSILGVAADRVANLIVVGTHGRGALGRITFGSVAAHVLRGAAVPVAIVPPAGSEVISLTDTSAVPHVGAVLVPVDFRSTSARQLAFASRLSVAAERGIVLVHALSARADKEASLERLRQLATAVDSARGVGGV